MIFLYNFHTLTVTNITQLSCFPSDPSCTIEPASFRGLGLELRPSSRIFLRESTNPIASGLTKEYQNINNWIHQLNRNYILKKSIKHIYLNRNYILYKGIYQTYNVYIYIRHMLTYTLKQAWRETKSMHSKHTNQEVARQAGNFFDENIQHACLAYNHHSFLCLTHFWLFHPYAKSRRFTLNIQILINIDPTVIQYSLTHCCYWNITKMLI